MAVQHFFNAGRLFLYTYFSFLSIYFPFLFKNSQMIAQIVVM